MIVLCGPYSGKARHTTASGFTCRRKRDASVVRSIRKEPGRCEGKDRPNGAERLRVRLRRPYFNAAELLRFKCDHCAAVEESEHSEAVGLGE